MYMVEDRKEWAKVLRELVFVVVLVLTFEVGHYFTDKPTGFEKWGELFKVTELELKTMVFNSRAQSTDNPPTLTVQGFQTRDDEPQCDSAWIPTYSALAVCWDPLEGLKKYHSSKYCDLLSGAGAYQLLLYFPLHPQLPSVVLPWRLDDCPHTEGRQKPAALYRFTVCRYFNGNNSNMPTVKLVPMKEQ